MVSLVHKKNQMEIQQLLLASGRHLSYVEFGTKNGTPVFYFHGFPGSHLDIGVFKGDEVATQLNIRLIAINRPGYGYSDSHPGRTLLDWPDDVTAVADSLNLDTFSVLGYSGGGPFALACAYKIPDRLRKVVVLSGMGPGNSPGAREVPSWAIIRWPGFMQRIILSGMRKMVTSNPEKILTNMNKSLSEVDCETMKNPEVQKSFIDGFREAFRVGYKGAMEDARIYKNNWGFEFQGISHQIYLWHGEKDSNVKIETARYITSQLPNSVYKFYPTEGHLSLIEKNSMEIFKLFVKE